MVLRFLSSVLLKPLLQDLEEPSWDQAAPLVPADPVFSKEPIPNL